MGEGEGEGKVQHAYLTAIRTINMLAIDVGH